MQRDRLDDRARSDLHDRQARKIPHHLLCLVSAERRIQPSRCSNEKLLQHLRADDDRAPHDETPKLGTRHTLLVRSTAIEAMHEHIRVYKYTHRRGVSLSV